MGYEHKLNSNRIMGYEYTLNSNRKMGYDCMLNSNRKMGYEGLLKPKVWLHILTFVILYEVKQHFSWRISRNQELKWCQLYLMVYFTYHMSYITNVTIVKEAFLGKLWILCIMIPLRNSNSLLKRSMKMAFSQPVIGFFFLFIVSFVMIFFLIYDLENWCITLIIKTERFHWNLYQIWVIIAHFCL